MLTFNHRLETIAADYIYLLCRSHDSATTRAYIFAAVAFGACERDFATVAGCVAACDADAVRFLAVHTDFLNVVFKNPLD